MLTGYAITMALLLVARYALLAAGLEIAALIGAIGVSAIVAGVVRNRPARRAPWLLLAAANLSTMIGRLTLNLATLNSHAVIAFPNFADAAYLIGYPLYVAGLALFIWSRTVGRDHRGAVDALVITVGLALLFWVFLVVPHATDTALSWPQRIVAVAYPLGDLVILASLARLLAPGTVRGTAAVLVTIAVVGGLGSDVAYQLIEYSGARNTPTLGLGWLVAFAAWGAAALHPAMTELTDPAAQREQTASKAKVIVVTLASLIPPIVLFTHGLKMRDRFEGTVAVACGVLYLLMFSRLWSVVTLHRRGQISERTLRMAGVSLAVAGSVEEVAAVVEQAAFSLIGASPRSGAVLAERKGGRLHAIIPGVDVPEMADPERTGDYPGRRLRELVEGRLSHLDRPTFIAAAEFGGMLPTGARLADGEGVLICPLMLRDRPSGDPHIGVLSVHGRRRTLDNRAEVLEILAGQAALAVERVSLSQQVIRHRGELLFRTLVQDTSDVILILADDGKIRYATPSAESIFGGVAVEGASLPELVALGGRDDISRVLDLILAGADIAGTVHLLRIERLDGHLVVVEVRSSDLRADPSVDGLVLTLRDVTEQDQLEQELKHRAFHDALTGLPNRALFARRAAEALGRAGPTGRTVGVLFVDLDDFKMVNDTMGHGTGDELLVAVAARLAVGVRASDTAARFGGDEFALLIDDAADPEAVDKFAERIVASFAEPFTLGESTVFAAISVGVATSRDSADSDELLTHADLALYAAKSAGKRQWRRYQPVLSAGMIRRREVQSALDDAVSNSEFTMAYQPLAALVSGQITGFEALIRWPRSRWGMMLPGEFIELAEETGHIVPLGAWVLTQALTDMVAWRARLKIPRDGLPGMALVPGPRAPEPMELGAVGTGTVGTGTAGPGTAGVRAEQAGRAAAELAYGGARASYSRPYVSVNVSARQFRDPGFVDGVRRALCVSGLPPSALLLELTESVVLGGTERIRAQLDELKEIGVRLAIDDFGTGYSSLSFLLELPIDVLKIDKAFVTGIAASWRRHAIVEGIVRLAATLEVDVIAEGIETETERELLVGMGCQYGQGYLLSVPVEAAEAEALLGLGHGLVPELPRKRRRPPTRTYLTDL